MEFQGSTNKNRKIASLGGVILLNHQLSSSKNFTSVYNIFIKQVQILKMDRLTAAFSTYVSALDTIGDQILNYVDADSSTRAFTQVSAIK